MRRWASVTARETMSLPRRQCPAGWTRRLAQPQQLTVKLFTSFRGPKFPDSGVVWGGAAWFPEYPERSEELANPQWMEVDREDQTAARHQSRHGNRQRNRAGGTRGCALRPRLSARRIDPDATASAGDRPATARGGQGTAVQPRGVFVHDRRDPDAHGVRLCGPE